MPKSNRGALLVDAPARSPSSTNLSAGPRSARENRLPRPVAVIGLLSATVLGQQMASHPGPVRRIGIGLVTAFITAALVRSGPCSAPLWGPRNHPRLALVAGWVELADHTTLPYRIGIVIILTASPSPSELSGSPSSRWPGLITRHRIRVCFSAFIITNRTAACRSSCGHPHRVGERVWIHLRPGLALTDLQDRATSSRSPAGLTPHRRPAPPASTPVRPPHQTPRRADRTASTPLLDLITPAPRPRPGHLPVPPHWTCPT